MARLRNNKVLERMARPHLKRPPGRPPEDPRAWFHEMTYRAKSWSKARRVVLVVLERPDELLLDRFWRITSLDAETVPAAELLERYRECGRAEAHMGELMDVLAPALSSVPRQKRHYRGRRLPERQSSVDAFAHNEVILLLNILAYEVVHAARCLLEAATKDRVEPAPLPRARPARRRPRHRLRPPRHHDNRGGLRPILATALAVAGAPAITPIRSPPGYAPQ